MKAILSEKGQITVPKPLRDLLGLKPGSVLDFDAIKGKLVAKKILSQDVFQKWRGRAKLPRGMTVDEYIAKLRDA